MVYNPPTKVTTIQMPYLALVVRADPEFERRKHREVEYEFERKLFVADPYVRGAYKTPVSKTIVNYAGPTTFNVGDLTGVGYDFVWAISQNATPGVLTTRTAAQMFSDIPNAGPLMAYVLRVVNFGGTSPLTLAPGQGVTFVNVAPINPNCFSDFTVTFADANNAAFTGTSANNPYNAISH